MKKNERIEEMSYDIGKIKAITYTEDVIQKDNTYKGNDDICDILANSLVNLGYVNIKEFAKALKQEFFFIKTTASKDAIYQFTDTQLNNFIKEFLKNE